MGLALLSILVIIFLFSIRLYISPKVQQNINPSSNRSTPARRQNDGVDFFPTRSSILAGFQLRSISLDIIISPIIAVQFGWLPAVLWLLIGAIFFGWVQDYLSIIISMRSAGKPITQLFEQYFNSLSKKLILIFLIAYLLIILSQFSLLISSLLTRIDIPLAILIFVMIALLSGFLIYRTKINLVLTTVLSITLAVSGIWLSNTAYIMNVMNRIINFFQGLGSLGSPDSIVGGFSWHIFFSLLGIFFVCYLGATLPSWRFAVPFNYISNWLVIIGFSIASLGLIKGTFDGSIAVSFELPSVITMNQPQIGPLWPILFVTLSSGAISGWHSLVSSYSTSHQVEKEPFVKPIAVGAMYAESIIVAIIIIFAAAFGVSSGIFDSDQNFTLTSGPASVFAVGFAETWNLVGISRTTASSISAILLVLMGLSILHLVVRYARITLRDLAGNRITFLRNPNINTIIILGISLVIVLFGFREWFWVLFAGANQLLASLVLLFASIWLAEQNKSISWTLYPSLFLFLTGLAAIFYSSIYQPYLAPLFSQSIVPNSFTPGSMITLVFAVLFSAIGIYIYFIGLRKLFQDWSTLPPSYNE